MQYEVNHPFVGKTAIRKCGKRYNIEKAYIEESKKLGAFLKFLIENNKSHGVLYWEAKTPVVDFIQKSINECRRDFEIVDKAIQQ